jgi:Zn-dependent peptidase ImmA (M78 family)/DNA-binding XRE family transcriptional regulator
MPRTPTAHVNPDVLRWARESAGFDTALAAKRIGVTEARITSWETGDAAPTIAQLRNVAEHYRRPPAFFFRPEPPESDDVPRPPDFRRLPASQRQPSVELLRELRAAAERRSFYLSLASEPTPLLRDLAINTRDPEVAARAFRENLQVTLDEQFSYRNDLYGALAMWVTAVENLGTLVSQTSRIPTAEFRGIALYFEPLPLIILNGSDAIAAKCFTVFHETYHLLLGSGSLCDIDRATAIERDCNRFAAEVLIPAAALAEDVGRNPTPINQVADLARKYSVSQDAIAIRLRELYPRRVSDTDVERVQAATAAALQAREDTDARVPFFRLRMRDLGRKYISAVFDAYYADSITLTEVAQRFRVKVPQVSQIEEAMFAPRGGS